MIFDGHSDLWIDIANKRSLNGVGGAFRKHHLPEFKKGNVNAGIFVFWADPPHDKAPKKRIDELINSAIMELDISKEITKLIKKHEDFNPFEKNYIQILLGMEGLSHIGTDIDLIDYYYNIGIRHASLTWNEENELATGVLGDKNRGLTKYGKAAVNRLEQLGMIVDVSHLNEKSFWDLASCATKPFIASHSNSRFICDDKRNLTDSQIKEIANSGGLIGMNSFRQFVGQKSEQQTVSGMIKHIKHIADLVGIEHISFGFDYCNYLDNSTLTSFTTNVNSSPGIEGLNEVSETRNLINEMKLNGFTENDIKLISSGNYERLFKEIL
jgi:membrane dipeptidase